MLGASCSDHGVEYGTANKTSSQSHLDLTSENTFGVMSTWFFWSLEKFISES